MNPTFRKELPIIGIVLLPFIYLALVWNSLPAKVPTHWSAKGDIDQWGDKISLLVMLFFMPVLVYFLFLIISKADPKKRILKMGGKFYQIKFLILLFMSLTSMYYVFIAKNQSFSSPNNAIIIAGIFFLIMGNYLKVIPPNHFIGIRTPWTLANNEVWKLTHILAGKLWFVGGLVFVLGGLIFEKNDFGFIYILLSLFFVPLVYSYIKHREWGNRK